MNSQVNNQNLSIHTINEPPPKVHLLISNWFVVVFFNLSFAVKGCHPIVFESETVKSFETLQKKDDKLT